MKTILVAMNSSYVHAGAAVRSISAALGNCAPFFEYNINQDSHDVLRDILAQNADVIGFSCYIWNVDNILRLAESVKLSMPSIKIVFGGPEASFRAKELLQNYFVDFVMCGECEESIADFLQELEAGGEITTAGVMYKKDGKPTGDENYQIVKDLSVLPQPFAAGDVYDENRIYYYESSRGCPFSCAYCMSGAMGGAVREKPLEQVMRELQEFVKRGARLVKFTDRTFNANAVRAKEIVRYVLEHTGDTAFHFEVALDLMDDEMIGLLSGAPKGKIQLEAGVQSTNAQTLAAVIRSTSIEKMKNNAIALRKNGNVHLHLDLIAGLPYETFERFKCSFNEVYALYADALQLGFLKLLPGTSLREDAQKYGIAYRSYAPYEVIKTSDISAAELLRLKGTEELLNRYYNSGRARTAFDYLTKNGIIQPFELYEGLYEFCAQNGYASRPIGARNQFVLLIKFAKERLKQNEQDAFFAALRIDYDNTKIKGQIPQELMKNI
ncbi:MAG: DUF4080 domain-containing protein, partial [Christensenella sp.]